MTDLYPLAMPGFPELGHSAISTSTSPGWVKHTQLICITHAHPLAEALRTVTSLVGDDFVSLDTYLPFSV
jgi:hypothetical protein